MDPLGPQAGHVHQERQGRRGAALQFLEQAQLTGPDDFLDLARQVLAHPGEPDQVLAPGRQVCQALGQATHHPGGVAVGPHPEGVGALDLQ